MKENSIYKLFKSKKLNEQLNIDGAEFIGSAFGFELYRILTYAAAQQFTTESGGEQTPAGQVYTQNEDTFNRHINDTVRLYFFVKENQPEVETAAISTGHSELVVSGTGCAVKVRNYSFEGAGNSQVPLNPDNMLPLYLLPDIQYNGENGLIITDGNLIGTYNGLIDPNNIPEEVIIPESVTAITKSNSFKDYAVGKVVIENTVQAIASNAFKGYRGIIKCAAEDADQVNWSSNWNGDCENIVWGIHLSPEEVAAREEAIRLERERREREEREREEAERREREFQNAETVSVLRYKKIGNKIVILGCKARRQKLDIPEEIEGCPVTEIGQFAFYQNKDLTEVKIPKTVEVIGKGAFYGCSNAIIYVPETTKTRYTDAFTGVRSIRDVR